MIEFMTENISTWVLFGLLVIALYLFSKIMKRITPSHEKEEDGAVEAYPKDSVTDLGPLVSVGSVNNISEATVLKSFLESHAIPTQIQGLHTRTQMGWGSNYVEMKILVPENLAEDVVILLREFETNDSVQKNSDLVPFKSLTESKPIILYASCLFLPGLGNRLGGYKTFGKILNLITIFIFFVIVLLPYFSESFSPVVKWMNIALLLYFPLGILDILLLAHYRYRAFQVSS